MEGLLKTLSTLRRSNNKFAQKHRFKNEQYLLSNKQALAEGTIYELYDHCIARLALDKPAAYILIMLFSARQLADVVENLYLYEEKNDNQVSKQLRLKTVWEHPKSNLKSSVLDIAPAKDSHCFVSLPSYLVDYVDIDSRTEGEVQLLEAQIIEFLKDIKNYLPKQRCTVAKLACCIKQYRTFFQISNYELCFISNVEIEREAMLYYGHSNRVSIQKKFDTFIDAIKDKSLARKKTHTVPDRITMVGSNYVVTSDAIVEIYDSLIKVLIIDCLSLRDLMNNYNVYTQLVVFYLQSITLHRPIKKIFRTIKSFDLISGQVNIRDKAEDSLRTRPLPIGAQRELTKYIEYLKDLVKKLKVVNPDLSAELQKSVTGEETLFRRINSRFSLVDFQMLDAKVVDVPPNFARHYASSYLDLEGICRDKIHYFMGHTSSSSPIYEFSSAHELVFVELAEILENHFLDLKIFLKTPKI
jgi:hypothetical protein